MKIEHTSNVYLANVIDRITNCGFEIHFRKNGYTILYPPRENSFREILNEGQVLEPVDILERFVSLQNDFYVGSGRSEDTDTL